MKRQTPILLSDEQVQRYIADGYIIVDSNLAPAFHDGVTKRVAYALEYELPHPGDISCRESRRSTNYARRLLFAAR